MINRSIDKLYELAKVINSIGESRTRHVAFVGSIFSIVVSVLSGIGVNIFSEKLEGYQIVIILMFFVFNIIILTTYSKISKMDIRELSENNIKKQYPKLSVVGIFLQEGVNKSTFLIQVLAGSSLVYAAFSYKHTGQPSLIVLTSPIVILILIILRDRITEYRVRNGFYGSNEYEAREIIKFIISNSKNIDFTDGGKAKKIISEADLREIQKSINAIPTPVAS